jgi:ribonuclease P protein component
MLAKKFRIERGQVQFILKKGESRLSKLFIIRYIENNKKFNRYCAIISKKIYPKAVPRNRLRRQIYQQIRLITEELNPQANLDILLIPKIHITKAKPEDIDQDLRAIITKHG